MLLGMRHYCEIQHLTNENQHVWAHQDMLDIALTTLMTAPTVETPAFTNAGMLADGGPFA